MTQKPTAQDDIADGDNGHALFWARPLQSHERKEPYPQASSAPPGAEPP